jgi:hypothetical protein
MLALGIGRAVKADEGVINLRLAGRWLEGDGQFGVALPRAG